MSLAGRGQAPRESKNSGRRIVNFGGGQISVRGRAVGVYSVAMTTDHQHFAVELSRGGMCLTRGIEGGSGGNHSCRRTVNIRRRQHLCTVETADDKDSAIREGCGCVRFPRR